ncbi:MAG: 2OG-Fe(II) oxygenase family protein [Actinomycetota bacterium]
MTDQMESAVADRADVVLVDGFVPVIDIAAALSGDPAARQATAAAIDQACSTSGFFVIAGHGVPPDLVKRMEDVALAFFSLPADVKARYAVAEGDPTIRGWYGTPSYVGASDGNETAPDLCELYTSCRLGDPGVSTPDSLGEDFAVWSKANVWPTEELPEFETTSHEYYDTLEAVSAQLMQLFALALGLEETFFDAYIDDHITNLTINHYPAVEGEPLPGQYRKGPHSDWGTLTVLYQDGTGGLEVLDRDADEWVSVPVIPGTFVVNIGDLMELWTNDRWRSTKHQVPVPPAEVRSVPRVSMPYFHQPNWNARVEVLPSCLPDGEEAKHPPVTSGQYLKDKIAMSYS